MSTIYHLLDEAEPFSERKGGAISRWAANVLRDTSEIIVCPEYDQTWGFNPERLYTLPNWSLTNPVHPILYRLPWPLQKAAYLWIFRPLLAKLKPGDVLYVHNRPECAAVLATLAERLGFRLILHMHNSHAIRTSRSQRATMKHLPIVFCSEFLRTELEAHWPGHVGRTGVVYNGADSAKFRIEDAHRNAVPVIVFTGRLVPYKGAHVLLQAMRILEDHKVAARCRIVGGSGFGTHPRTVYIRRLEKMHAGNSELVGYRSGDDLAALVRQSDIFCCPSIWNDPFPLSPIEGMASGLPVVASGTGGIPEALAFGGGRLVPPNDPAALAAELERLILDVDLREALGREASRAFQQHFRWSNARQQYQDFVTAAAT